MKFFFIEGDTTYEKFRPIKPFYFEGQMYSESKIIFVNKFFKQLQSPKQVFTPEEADVIITVGGDGTLLDSIKHFKHFNKPFYGIGGGTENAIMNDISDMSLFRDFDLDILNVNGVQGVVYDYELDINRKRIIKNLPFNMIKATIDGKEYQGFNEIAIGRDMNSWINFNIEDEDDEIFIPNFLAGGVVICTPQGSTGMNKNNFGTVMPLSSINYWNITGDKSQHDIKINKLSDARPLYVNVETRNPFNAWIDGQAYVVENIKDKTIKIDKGDSVNVVFTDYKKFINKR